ncbi:PAS domain S-box protein [Halorarius halobius]|uniref:PAS domain S-box protein n=1 Tax=Halorarius halobius TaxID=2962671 RepID=UPI0020CCB912|nr:PAS domain S-box protein [Halorarius halobius]
MDSFRVLSVGTDAAVSDALEEAGFAVTVADDIADAVASLPGADCVVTAAALPDGDGVDLCERVRARWPDVSVVLYAADGDASVASAAFAAGASDYVLESEVPPAALPGRILDRTDQAGTQYQRLVETMGDMLYVVDAAGRFRFVNEASESTTGYRREELVGEHVSLVMDEADIERGEEAVKRLVSPDAPGTVTFEMAIRTRDGDHLPVENHVAPLPMPDGEFRGTVGVIRDVSARKRRVQRLRDLHDATREMAGETSVEGVAAVTAAAAADVLGYPINAVRVVRDGELVPVAVRDRTREVLGDRPTYDVDGASPAARALRTGEPVVVEEFADAPESHRQMAAAMYLPLGDHGTLSIGTLDAEGFDETDRKLAALLAANATATLGRLRQREQLETSHDRLTALFENIPDPTIYVEFEEYRPVVRDANPAFEQVFGLSSEAVEGECVDDYILPDGADDEAEEYNQLIQSGESFHGEVRRVAADGPRDFLLHVVPYAVGERSTRGFAIYTDITDHKERERQLERQNDRLEQFASVVSHDLRNPLNVAQGHLDLARERGAAENFDAIERSLDRMEGLIDGLLRLARQGQALGETELVDLAAVARAAWRGVDTGEADLTVESLPTVEGDPERLRQLFENLFRNAVEHAGDDVTVTVGSRPQGFYVADDGPGLPEGGHDRLFEFGHSGDEGTGFGLAIVREIVEAHGWEVHADPDGPGEGATFAVTGVVPTTPR